MKTRTLLAGGIALVLAPVLMAQTPPSISSVVNLNPSVSLGACQPIDEPRFEVDNWFIHLTREKAPCAWPFSIRVMLKDPIRTQNSAISVIPKGKERP